MHVNIIGSGNVATVLGRLIKNAGHGIAEVVSRNFDHAVQLSEILEAKAVGEIVHMSGSADLYIVAVSDTAIPLIAAQLQNQNGVVVHTSGAVSKNVLEGTGRQFGVLYPLQSLRKELEAIPPVSFLVDGNSDNTTEIILAFAKTLSERVRVCNDEERLKMHLSAVMVSNFTNHLYALTEQYCQREELDFSFLYPMIAEVANRLQYTPATHLQTGPAMRGDETTIQRHQELLKDHPHLKIIYNDLTESIRRFYGK